MEYEKFLEDKIKRCNARIKRYLENDPAQRSTDTLQSVSWENAKIEAYCEMLVELRTNEKQIGR